jgi:hypothetical protein
MESPSNIFGLNNANLSNIIHDLISELTIHSPSTKANVNDQQMRQVLFNRVRDLGEHMGDAPRTVKARMSVLFQ